MKYRTYLLRRAPMPRTTRHRQKKREEQERLALQDMVQREMIAQQRDQIAQQRDQIDEQRDKIAQQREPPPEGELSNVQSPTPNSWNEEIPQGFGDATVPAPPESANEEMDLQPSPLSSSPHRPNEINESNIVDADGIFPDSTLSLEEPSNCKTESLCSGQNIKSPQGDEVAALCPCTKATSDDVVLMCLALGLRHNLTWEAQVDFLKIINAIFGENTIETTKYSYLKRIGETKSDITYHVYCPECEIYIDKTENLKGRRTCDSCSKEFDIANSFFISLSLESQIKQLLSDPNVAESMINYRFNRERMDGNVLQDIYDGAEYQKHCKKGGLLANPLNFSYNFCTDGICTGKSTGKTLWPVFITLNEIPPKERGKHVLLAGLYIGSKDPNQTVFLEPFVEQANKLSTEGVKWQYKNDEVISKIIPMCAVLDSVARYQVQNMQAFNAIHGCTMCYQTQERTRRGRKYVLSMEKAPDRTVNSTRQDLQRAYERRFEPNLEDRHCNGVKGPSPLMNLLYFQFILAFVVDYMHNILLGVIRMHTDLILEATRRKFWKGLEEDSIGMSHLISVVDKRLSTIKPPSCITRTPRSLTDMKIWKASEWRSWLLFYCVPCLSGLLKEKHLLHLAMLSKATNLLLQSAITIEQVHEAHRLLMLYTANFEEYFGEEFMVYNIHLLSHICKGVLNWGPLWTHNCFWYENQNRLLLKLYKSPFQVTMQIARKYLIFNAMPSLTLRLATNKQTIHFCSDIFKRGVKLSVRSGDGVVLLGKGYSFNGKDREEINCLNLATAPSLSLASCTTFKRCLIKGKKFCTSAYCVEKKTMTLMLFCPIIRLLCYKTLYCCQTQL